MVRSGKRYGFADKARVEINISHLDSDNFRLSKNSKMPAFESWFDSEASSGIAKRFFAQMPT